MKTISKFISIAATGMLLAACSSTPSTPSTAGGSYPPTNAANVRLYPAGTTPVCQNYATVGNISVSTLNAMGNQASQDEINQSLKDQAASMGGTGVMNIQNNGSNQDTGTVIHCISRY